MFDALAGVDHLGLIIGLPAGVILAGVAMYAFNSRGLPFTKRRRGKQDDKR